MRTTIFSLLLIFLAGTAQADTAKVTYVTSQSFYVDAGSASGLIVGSELVVLREGAMVGKALVQEVSSNRAVCEVTTPGLVPAVGDTVSYIAAAPAAVAAADPAHPSWFDRMGLHGRVGLQTLHMRDRSGFGGDYDRPSLTLRLRSQALGGSSIGTEIDIRSAVYRSSYRGESDTRGQSRIYRLNFFGGAPAGGFAWGAGRQFAPSLSVVHLFDGVRLQFERTNWTAGVLGGTQPDPDGLGLSSDVFEGGAWFTWRQRSSMTRWSLTTAAVASWLEGSSEREFAWIQGRWSRGPFVARADQVIDLNRGWKQDAGEPLISSTSTYLMASWQAHAWFGLNGGLDTRRRVRLLRDRNTPETEFDDSYRQGYWLGVRSRPLSWLDIGLRGRTRLRADAERADSASLNIGFRTGWWRSLRFDSRSSVYQSELVEGWLQSIRASAQLSPRISAGIFGGARGEDGKSNDLMDSIDPWGGADVDFSLSRSAWLSLRWESNFDGEEAADQLWLGTGLRF